MIDYHILSLSDLKIKNKKKEQEKGRRDSSIYLHSTILKDRDFKKEDTFQI